MTEMEARDLLTRIPAYAAEHRLVIQHAFNYDLDFSAKSIPALDEMIKTAWPGEPPNNLDEIILGFGSYLGESIRTIHGGEWRYAPADGVYLDVASKGIKIFPFMKIHERFVNGENDSLAYYYAVIRQRVQANL